MKLATAISTTTLALLCLGAFSHAKAGLSVSPLFGDHVVLQRDKPVPVWGKASPGEKIEVHFRGQKKDAVADAAGAWKVLLDPMPTSSEPAELLIVSPSGKLQLTDILVGEVWVCSGQSNMNYMLRKCVNGTAEMAAADHPQIRFFHVDLASLPSPTDALKGKWEVCSPTMAARIRGVPYFFGRELQQELGVPVGLIVSAWGGTPIESWMSDEALAATRIGRMLSRSGRAVRPLRQMIRKAPLRKRKSRRPGSSPQDCSTP